MKELNKQQMSELKQKFRELKNRINNSGVLDDVKL